MTINFGKKLIAFFLSAGLFILPDAGTQAQTISTLAGDGYQGLSEIHENIEADSTGLNYPAAVAVDAAGNVYIADQKNNRIRKVNAKTGLIATVAGNGSFKHYGFSGDNGLADSAELTAPMGVAVDAAGNIYIADTHNQRIRKVAAKTNIITTFAGTRDNGYSGDGGPANAAELSNPSGLAVDAAGNVYISDFGNNRIREVNIQTGIITTIAGNGTSGYSGDGKDATAAELNNPRGLAIDGSTIYVADFGNNCIRKISGGIITTIAGNGNSGFSGDDGPAASAQLNSPTGVALDAAGNIYISDAYNNRIRKISGGTISTVVGNGNKSFSGDGSFARSATINTPYDVTVDGSNNLYIADYLNNRVRKVKMY